MEGSTPNLLYEVGTPFSHFAVPQDTLATAQARSVGISDCSFAARETMRPRHVPPTADVALVGLTVNSDMVMNWNRILDGYPTPLPMP